MTLNNMNIDVGFPVLNENQGEPSAPEFSPEFVKTVVKSDKSKYYKLLSSEYKEENESLYESGKDILKRNKRIRKENKELKKELKKSQQELEKSQQELEKSQKIIKETNTSLLQEMENNAILHSNEALLKRMLNKKVRSVENHNQYCYIPRKF